MPRIAPYFRGDIAQAAGVAVPRPVDPWYKGLEGQIGSSIGSLFAGSQAPAVNPAHQAQADYYAAQAADQRYKTTHQMRQDSALSAAFTLPTRDNLDPNAQGDSGAISYDDIATAAGNAYAEMIKGEADPDKAATVLATRLATLPQANLSPDDVRVIMSRVLSANGKYLGKDQAVDTADRDTMIARAEANTTARNDADNATSRANNAAQVAESARAHSMESSDRRRGQDISSRDSRYSTDRSFSASVFNNAYTNTMDYQKAALPTTLTESNGAKTKAHPGVFPAAPQGGAASGGAKAPASDPFPGIAEGQIVEQGGHKYQRRGNQMVAL